MAENPTRARTQILDFPIAEQLISYDPAMVPVCGGVAAALLFCWFEALFLSPHQTPAFIAKTMPEWRAGVGMRAHWFAKAFRKIGVCYLCPDTYNFARLGGREFWSESYQRHLFYSLEVTKRAGPAILRRSAFEIDYALNLVHQVDTTMATEGSKLSGKLTAKDLAKRLHL